MTVATDDSGRPFTFLDAWEIMRNIPMLQAAKTKEAVAVKSGSSSKPGEGKYEKGVKIGEFYRKATQERPKCRKSAEREKQDELKGSRRFVLISSP